MRTKITTLFIVASSLLIFKMANAQNTMMPPPSSSQTITQGLGLGKITVNYSRPNMKGRKVFGGMEPYGSVWRTGANGATTLQFSNDVTIADKVVPAGKYALFTIPDKNEWTIILNKGADQWGAYSYKESDDIVRLKVKPAATKGAVETFTIYFGTVTENIAELHIMWENTDVMFAIKVDDDAKIMANIDKAMAGDKKPYFAAAQYYYSHDKDLNKALEWITEAEKADAKGPWFKLWKARIQLKMGDKQGAIATAQQGLDIAKEINNAEYIRLNQQLIDSAKK